VGPAGLSENEHRIVDVEFLDGGNDGPLRCTCGEEMQASEFAQHRKDVRASHVPANPTGEGTAWKRTRRG
jgi:hypothetical protein